jgi:DNA-binding NarL/FixJ family response regulator
VKYVEVFMVTMSKAEDDKSRAYGHHVAGYIVKQNSVNTFLDAISLLKHYWKIVEFPE